jgi:hypothetical protein
MINIFSLSNKQQDGKARMRFSSLLSIALNNKISDTHGDQNLNSNLPV